MPTNVQSTGRIRFGAFEIDPSSGELWQRGNRIRLQEQPFQVLCVLLEHPGKIVTREELQKAVWPADTFVDFDNGLNTAIRKIRDALGDSSERPRYIETVPRRGYRFIHAVELEPEAQASQLIGSVNELASAASFLSKTPAKRRALHRAGSVTIGVLTLVAVLIGADLGRKPAPAHGSGAKPRVESLAVLPLKNLSSDASHEYLADGMTEALIGRLAGIKGLRVISRTSSMHFKGTQLSVPQIARTLHVDAIVEGSVIRDGNRIRVHAQLIRAATDEHFWSETYDREMQDVLSLQGEVAQSIARKVEVTVSGQEHTRLSAARSVSPQVYESYLKGQYTLDKSNNKADVDESIGYFNEAIKRDPKFAPAYAGLADAYSEMGTIFIGAPPSEARAKESSAARKALELDPELVEARVLLADVYQRQWQWADAEAEYKQALESNPSNAVANERLAGWLACQGRTEEAIVWAQRAHDLDPLGTTANTAWILFLARRYDEAAKELHTALATRPDDVTALWNLGFVLIVNDQAKEAIPLLEKSVYLTQRSPGPVELLATAYARAGRRIEAIRLIDELKRRRQTGYVPAGAFINPHIGLRSYDEAFVWFERAYQEQSNILQFLKVHPFFDPIRDDPRFKDLLHRVGLDHEATPDHHEN